MLDFNPGNNVSAFERVVWKPSGRTSSALLLIRTCANGEQLKSSEVVGEFLALAVVPVAGTTYPGCLQRNYMVLETHHAS